MRNISSWAIRNPIPPIVFFIVLTFLGVVAFTKLPITDQPDISFPAVSVNISQPGAAPSEMETQVTQKIEGAVASIGNVDSITAYGTEGSSTVVVNFQVGTPVDRAVSDVRDAVARVRSDLPEGILEPQVEREDFDGGAIGQWSVVTSDMTLEQLSWFIDNAVSKKLLGIKGVAKVGRIGGVAREININLDPARLQSFGLTAVQVNSALRSLNLDAAGGRADVAGAEQSLRVLGGAKTADVLADTQIAIGNGRFVRLADVATVRDGTQEQRQIARLNGRQVTAFDVFKAKGASEVAAMDAVQKALAKLQAENPKIRFVQITDRVQYVRDQYHSAIEAMIEGAILAVLVVWLFLRDWRATVISALAIPLSSIPTFFFMDALGFSLNGLSLLALSLVAGILVDDAIVEIENIVRHMNMGKSAWQASIDAADEIGLAVVATTFAIVAVFLPVALMPGVSGQFFKQFGLTVVISVLMSLLVARLITPLVAAYFLKPGGVKPHGQARWLQAYLRILGWTLRHRWLTVLGGALSFALTIVLFAQLPLAFQPPFDQSESQATIEMAPGTRLADTARIAGEATRRLLTRPEVQQVFETIGDDEDTRNASLDIKLVPPSQRKLSQVNFERDAAPLLRSLPDARANFTSQAGGLGHDVTLMLVSGDPVQLRAAAEKLVAGMRGLSMLRDTRIDGDLNRPEIVIRPRFDVAASLGVSVASLSQTIRIATLGDIPQNLAKFSLSDRQIPIRVMLPEDVRADLGTIENLPVPTASGGAVPLKVVADVRFGEGPVKIRRYNQERRIAIVADLAPGAQGGDATIAIHKLPAYTSLPSGVTEAAFGESKILGELIVNFIFALVSGVLLVFAVLVLLYRRVLPPFVNMASLLLAPLGSAIALLATGYALSLPVFIGLLMLIGIVAKNSILLIDFAIEDMRLGADRATAILEAGHKRAQPIVMTTVAMVAGMVPIAIGLGDGSWRAPMGVTVIGGLLLSTVLTLLIVPAAFTIADDIEKWLGPRARRLFTGGASAPAPQPVATPAE